MNATSVQVTRRRYERVPFFCRAVITAPRPGPPLEARSIDISLGGVGLCANRGVPKGEQVTVEFYLRGNGLDETVERVTGTVVAVHAELDGCRMGIEFTDPLRRATNPALVRKIEDL